MPYFNDPLDGIGPDGMRYFSEEIAKGALANLRELSLRSRISFPIIWKFGLTHFLLAFGTNATALPETRDVSARAAAQH